MRAFMVTQTQRKCIVPVLAEHNLLVFYRKGHYQSAACTSESKYVLIHTQTTCRIYGFRGSYEASVKSLRCLASLLLCIHAHMRTCTHTRPLIY